jgi:hypothetical protein
MGDLDARFNRAIALERARSLGIAVNGNPIMDAAQAGAVRPLHVLRCGSCFLFTTAILVRALLRAARLDLVVDAQ